tara:strand:- start:31933 stop:32718 length:786 start_codon:yes stop_codon:yes gene_type:complete
LRKLTSLQNPFIKSLVHLKEKAKTRKQKSIFLIEGQKEICLAMNAGYQIENILFCSKICSEDKVKRLSEDIELIEITKEIFEKLAYRDTTEGLIAIAKAKDLSLTNLKLTINPLILIAESLEKPGNIGALLRTAEAAKVDAVIISDPKCDLYNPNVVRSSIGCVFTNQVAIGTASEIISFLKKNQITIYCASLQSTACYDQQDYKSASAFVVGNEAVGLSEKWKDSKFQNITIPMQGKIDSMNVSVSAAILIFEAKRQRGF